MLGHDEDINSYEKRIAELEADAKRWKDAFTTSQTHLDVVAEKLIPLLPGGWKHDWAGDVADGISERIAELEAERDRLHTRTGVLGAQVDEAKRERDRLLADNVALREALEGVKVRIAFIGHPGESFWEANGISIPDWREEISAIDAALTNPAPEALERVRREAQAEAFEEARRMAACLSSSVIEMELGFKRDSARAAALRGGE